MAKNKYNSTQNEAKNKSASDCGCTKAKNNASNAKNAKNCGNMSDSKNSTSDKY